MNIKAIVCGSCLHHHFCNKNYDFECKQVAKWIFINLLSRNKGDPIK